MKVYLTIYPAGFCPPTFPEFSHEGDNPPEYHNFVNFFKKSSKKVITKSPEKNATILGKEHWVK